jgi:hypothetical protein
MPFSNPGLLLIAKSAITINDTFNKKRRITVLIPSNINELLSPAVSFKLLLPLYQKCQPFQVGIQLYKLNFTSYSRVSRLVSGFSYSCSANLLNTFTSLVLLILWSNPIGVLLFLFVLRQSTPYV